MENRCPLKGSNIKTRIDVAKIDAPWFKHLLQLVFALLAVGSTLTAQATSLQPYRAIYTTTYKGMTADAEQILQPTSATQFVLSRNIKTMFVKLAETSEFTIGVNGLQSSRYTYIRGGLASKKNIEQLFQWQKNNLQVTENSRVLQVAIAPPLLDKLNYTEAVRWQLLNAATPPKNLTVKFADRHHLKQYDFVVAGKDDITLPSGKVGAVRLERHIPEENRHTLIWFAPSMDYLLVGFQQTDERDRFELHLKSYEKR